MAEREPSYNPKTGREIRGTMTRSLNGDRLWVVVEQTAYPIDEGEFADRVFGLRGVKEGSLPDLEIYREKMRELVGKNVIAIVEEANTEPGTFRVTNLNPQLMLDLPISLLPSR